MNRESKCRDDPGASAQGRTGGLRAGMSRVSPCRDEARSKCNDEAGSHWGDEAGSLSARINRGSPG